MGPRSPGLALYRQARFREYFRRAAPLPFPFSSFTWRGLPLGLGRGLNPEELRSWEARLGVPILQGDESERHTALLAAAPPPRPAPPAELGVHILVWSELAHHLVGLLDALHRTLALGLVLRSPVPERSLPVLTPLPPSRASQVRFIQLGQLRLTPRGEELTGHVSC